LLLYVSLFIICRFSYTYEYCYYYYY